MPDPNCKTNKLGALAEALTFPYTFERSTQPGATLCAHVVPTKPVKAPEGYAYPIVEQAPLCRKDAMPMKKPVATSEGLVICAVCLNRAKKLHAAYQMTKVKPAPGTTPLHKVVDDALTPRKPEPPKPVEKKVDAAAPPPLPPAAPELPKPAPVAEAVPTPKIAPSKPAEPVNPMGSESPKHAMNQRNLAQEMADRDKAVKHLTPPLTTEGRVEKLLPMRFIYALTGPDAAVAHVIVTQAWHVGEAIKIRAFKPMCGNRILAHIPLEHGKEMTVCKSCFQHLLDYDRIGFFKNGQALDVDPGSADAEDAPPLLADAAQVPPGFEQTVPMPAPPWQQMPPPAEVPLKASTPPSPVRASVAVDADAVIKHMAWLMERVQLQATKIEELTLTNTALAEENTRLKEAGQIRLPAVMLDQLREIGAPVG
jgi:hypothetical protein